MSSTSPNPQPNAIDLIPEGKRMALHAAAETLHERFQGVFGIETIEELVADSYLQIDRTATVKTWLVVSADRLAKERLEAILYSEDQSPKVLPAVLFLCTHNAGRSQMALGWFNQLAGADAVAWSGGSEPGSEVNSEAVAAMAEVGIDISQGFPKPWTNEVLSAVDVVVTMGCGDACPLLPGKHYEDWEVEDPDRKSLEEIRPIRDELKARVTDLLTRLSNDASPDPTDASDGQPLEVANSSAAPSAPPTATARRHRWRRR